VRVVAGDVIEVERRIAARPDTVFAYFTDPERFVRWFGTDAQLDPRPGGTFRVTVTGRSRLVASGTFIEIDPPTRLVYTWGWEPTDGVHDGLTEVPAGSTTVEVTFEEDGASTVLRLRHSGLPTPAACEFHTAGWDLTLDRLAIVAAGGDPGPDALADL
jgi:uncharacterized protein YndB with AHSA1/START domain